MFRSMRWLATFAAAALLTAPVSAGLEDPVPQAAAQAASFADHQAQCRGKEGWSDPAPPIRIFGNVYDVGTCGIVVVLIVGGDGAILIDGATAAAVPAIVANIERLGVKLSDVKRLLSTHEHADHAGGLHDLRRITGASMVARAAAREALTSGRPAQEDPQLGSLPPFRGVQVDRIVPDGGGVRLGSLRLTAHATPGHAPGGTSWSWRACEGNVCHDIVYADSISAVSSRGYRFSDHPDDVRTFRTTLARISGMRCDLLLTPHPAASNLYDRLAGKAPLAAAGACTAYASAASTNLDRRLREESQHRP